MSHIAAFGFVTGGVLPSGHRSRTLLLHGDSAHTVTHTNAPPYRVVRARIDAADWKSAETVVPEAADSIDSIDQSKDDLLATYFDGIKGRVVRHEFSSDIEGGLCRAAIFG